MDIKVIVLNFTGSVSFVHTGLVRIFDIFLLTFLSPIALNGATEFLLRRSRNKLGKYFLVRNDFDTVQTLKKS